MALHCGKVDADTIHLVSHWKSDAMFWYLHAQALPLIRDLAATMLTHGNFTLLPGADVPPHITPNAGRPLTGRCPHHPSMAHLELPTPPAESVALQWHSGGLDSGHNHSKVGYAHTRHHSIDTYTPTHAHAHVNQAAPPPPPPPPRADV